MTNETILPKLIGTLAELPEHTQKVVQAYGAACYRTALKSTEVQALRKDSERLDWLEQQTKQSPTGASFDYVRYIENGRVLEQGYRFMRRHFMGERRPTIREAINAAMEQKHEP